MRMFKSGDLVEFTDEDGNLKRGRVDSDYDPDFDIVMIEYMSVDGHHIDNVRLLKDKD